MKQSSNIFTFIMSFFFRILLFINNVSEKLLIHEHNYAVFFLSLMLLPTLIYAIKVSSNQIPLPFLTLVLSLSAYTYVRICVP